MNLHIFYFLIK